MAQVVNPNVQIVGFGPRLELPNGTFITPDEFVLGAARVTYKDMDVLEELREKKEEDLDFSYRNLQNALISVAGAGHASMATTPGFWAIIGGTSSKMVDSAFTGARFSSSLMPSGRRIPIEVENIVIPKGIFTKGEKVIELYMDTSKKNILLYQDLQERGVPKQEASKIVQYGHKGGGFMFMPLETLIHFSKDFEANPDLIPDEAREVVRQLEECVVENGAGITYFARREAPRTSCVNPSIFHDRENYATSLIDSCNGFNGNVLEDSVVLDTRILQDKNRDRLIEEYLNQRRNIFESTEDIELCWKEELRILEEIVTDYNDTVRFLVASNTPWRVWGEVKRHRTLPQTTESVYHAVDRAIRALQETGLYGILESEIEINDRILNKFKEICSLPKSVRNNNDNRKDWISAFINAMRTYQILTDNGVSKSDSIMVIPRGLKMVSVKDFDLYNLGPGYTSLRFCNTAEPEMRQITAREMTLVRKVLEGNPHSGRLSELITAKCEYTGFCPERKYTAAENPCRLINRQVPSYNEDFHTEFMEERKQEIRSIIENH